MDANGMLLTLSDGQTEVSFALVQQGDVTADGSLQLSATCAGTDQSATKYAGNSIAVFKYSTVTAGRFDVEGFASNERNFTCAA